MIDEYLAVVVLHRSQQACERHRRVRRPIAVMAAVQLVTGTVERDRKFGDPASAEHNLLTPALMHRAVADQPDIAFQQVFVPRDDLRQMRRTGLLLALDDELDVLPDRDLRSGE